MEFLGGRGKARRAAKKESKARVKEAKRERKEKTKMNRIESRGRKKDNRIMKRERASAGRVSARDKKTQGRIKKRLDKKGYGYIDNDSLKALEAVEPMQDAMSDVLDDRGIDHDRDDDIETAAKFAQTNPDIIDPLDDQTYDDAFVNPDDYYAGDENFENFDWKGIAKKAAKGALGGISKSIGDYVTELKDKAASGKQLTADEQKILNASDKVNAKGKEIVMEKITDSLKDMALPIIILLVILFMLKKS